MKRVEVSANAKTQANMMKWGARFGGGGEKEGGGGVKENAERIDERDIMSSACRIIQSDDG
jgi:hypothetical protein